MHPKTAGHHLTHQLAPQAQVPPTWSVRLDNAPPPLLCAAAPHTQPEPSLMSQGTN